MIFRVEVQNPKDGSTVVHYLSLPFLAQYPFPEARYHAECVIFQTIPSERLRNNKHSFLGNYGRRNFAAHPVTGLYLEGGSVTVHSLEGWTNEMRKLEIQTNLHKAVTWINQKFGESDEAE